MSTVQPTLASFSTPIHALVVGASRGIGLGFVRALLSLEHVAVVYAASRRPEESEGLQEMGEEHGGRLVLLALDITDDTSIAACAASLDTHSSSLHLLINVVGVLHDEKHGVKPEKQLSDVEPSGVMQSFAVNALGPLLLAKHFYPFFQHRDHAVFASLSARVGSIEDNRLGGWYAYRASKAAQNMFMKTVSLEFKRRARSTVCVLLHPGTVDTQLSKPFQRGVPPERLFSVERAVRQLLVVIDALSVEDSGAFFAWDGQPIPW